jgi:hypothetical protein
LAYDAFMRRKVAVAILVVIAMITSSLSAVAGPVVTKNQAKQASSSLQKLVNSNLSSMKQLDTKLAQDSLKIQNLLKQDLETINSLYALDSKNLIAQIGIALQKIDALSKFVVQVDNLSRCNGLCTKGAILVLPFNAKDESAQRSIDQNVAGGALSPQDKTNYDLARKNYQTLIDQQPILQGKFQQDVTDRNAKARQDLGIINYSYEIAIETAKQELRIIRSALLASKRAVMSSTNFESNFKIAMEFEYNLQMIEMVADSPFSSITSVLSARAVLSAADDYEVGSAIDQRYSVTKAKAFNKRFGNAFTRDIEFRNAYSQALKFYRAANT